MAELVTLKFRRGTETEWSTANPVLSAGEPGYATDTRVVKIGNGTTNWNNLPITSRSYPDLSIPIAIGNSAGATGQGVASIAIGSGAGATNQPANTIILNASGSAVNGNAGVTGCFYVSPIRQDLTKTIPLLYDPGTFEIVQGTSSLIGNTDLTGFPQDSILLNDNSGGITGSTGFSFNTTNGIGINTSVQTNRLVTTGYIGAFYSDDYGDSWTGCTGTIPVYAAESSQSGVWIGANGTYVVSSTDGINWINEFPLDGQAGNDNKYGIGFNGNACVVGTVTGNVAFCPNVTLVDREWSSPSQLSGVNISGLAWNPTDGVWWLFGKSTEGGTIYSFDGFSTPVALSLSSSPSTFSSIPYLFTGADAWCMCGISTGDSTWVIGGKGPTQNSSLAILRKGTTFWSVEYETSITNGGNYLRCLATDGINILGGHTSKAIISSLLDGVSISSWSNHSTVYARWIDLIHAGGYWFAGVGSPFNLGRSVMWSDQGIRWDSLFVGPGITTAYTIRASPGLISGISTVLASSFNPNRIGILTANPYTTLDVRGNIASYTQYMNVGASDNGLNLVKNNVSNPAGGTYPSAGVFSLDIPDANVSVIEVVGAFKLTDPSGGTYGILRVNNLGQLLFNSYTPGGTGITGPITLA